MTHTTEELLFAAEVRRIVSERRRARKPEEMTPEEAEAWAAEPADALILEVVRELEGIAGVIARSRMR